MAALGWQKQGRRADEELASPFPPDTLTRPGWAASDSPALSPGFICNQEVGH